MSDQDFPKIENYGPECKKNGLILIGSEALKAKFPNGHVQCSECGAYYDSRDVYIASHSAPNYEWVGGCGHARLKWKNAPREENKELS